jgi:hypothetical protein
MPLDLGAPCARHNGQQAILVDGWASVALCRKRPKPSVGGDQPLIEGFEHELW